MKRKYVNGTESLLNDIVICSSHRHCKILYALRFNDEKWLTEKHRKSIDSHKAKLFETEADVKNVAKKLNIHNFYIALFYVRTGK